MSKTPLLRVKIPQGQHEYVLTVDLNALHHLGINLYSNVPAVLSEIVANAWDADATVVSIDIDAQNDRIVVTDDGCGMSKDDINSKFLKVGYQKRKDVTITPEFNRHVMGRKGIGKLSLFSIAADVEVQSVRKISGKLVKSGCKMNTEKIEASISANHRDYHPDPVSPEDISISKGTRIILTNLKKNIVAAETFLRRKLARRFSILGSEYNFAIKINNAAITVADRDYFNKLEYLWVIGDNAIDYVALCPNLKKHMDITGDVSKTKGYKVTGWIGTFDEQKSIDEGNNTIVIQSWGKLIQEDILKDMKEGGLFSKYLIGEVRADFLDLDDHDDIATSDRQRLLDSDPRVHELRKFLEDKVLNIIQNKWRDWRNEGAEKSALESPQIKEWFMSLSRDNKKYARQLFGKIESLPVQSADVKRELYKQSILAFETLALKGSLSALDGLSSERDFEVFSTVFEGIDQLEAFHYFQIIQGRLSVLKKFEHVTPTAKERVIQDVIFDHLWLLDPTWERAAFDARKEEALGKEFGKITALSADEKKGRLDIRYRTAAGKHIIIELKKYSRTTETSELLGQVQKYHSGLKKCLNTKFPGQPHVIEIICVLGTPPKPWDEEQRNTSALRAYDARFITYDTLIDQTKQTYREYLDAQEKVGRIQRIVEGI